MVKKNKVKKKGDWLTEFCNPTPVLYWCYDWSTSLISKVYWDFPRLLSFSAPVSWCKRGEKMREINRHHFDRTNILRREHVSLCLSKQRKSVKLVLQWLSQSISCTFSPLPFLFISLLYLQMIMLIVPDLYSQPGHSFINCLSCIFLSLCWHHRTDN